MSQLLVDDIVNKDDSGAPGFSKGVVVGTAVTINSTGINISSGIVTATTFSGNATSATSATNASGLTGTPNITVGSITAASGSVSGNFSVAGTLTYEDVTNIDSVGLITARGGIDNQKRYTESINTVSGTAIDCAEGNYYTKTVTGATAFTFTNVPTSVAYFLTIEVTCNGSNAVTWPASVMWPADTAPTITDGKTTLFMFVTDDGGTRWRGSSLADYTN